MSENSLRPLLCQPKALIMGVINITPDSFSDGGRYSDVELAVNRGLELVEQGADILDIGGESTRPGADHVSTDEELERVIPVIEALVSRVSTPVSIDTYKPIVMSAAVDAGVSMINDVNGLRAEGAMDVVSKAKLPVCIMHMQGDPQTMQSKPSYDNVVSEVAHFFNDRLKAAALAGIDKHDVLLDPGIGFGKTLDHNLQLLNALPFFKANTACELLIGVSRKSLIDKLLGRDVNQRGAASLGLAVQSILNGAKIVRVHDVRETYDAIRVVEAVAKSQVTN